MNSQVLILGAGASIPYGFPSGPNLTKHLYKDYWPKRKELIERVSNQLIANYEYRPPFPDYYDFADKFFSELETSKIWSVDSFVEKRATQDPKNADRYAQVASIGICYLLADYELRHRKRGFSTETYTEPTYPNVAKSQPDWFINFWNKITAGANTYPDLVEVCKRISVVTFNYERSFEIMFWSRMQVAYADILEHNPELKLPIEVHHVYGSLGDIFSRPYSKEVELWENFRGEIRLIGDPGRAENEEIIKRKIWDADRLLFLGFHYDTTNLFRLGCGAGRLDVVEQKSHKRIYGTALNRHPDELHEAASLLKTLFESTDRMFFSKDVPQYLLTEADCDQLITRKFRLT